MASLEYNVEQAILQLLEAVPQLAAIMPRHSEYFYDCEPSQEEPGNLQNPNLSAQASKQGEYVGQTCFFKIGVRVPLWIEVDEHTETQGIDDLFHLVESVLDDPALHLVIMENPNNRQVMDVEYSRQRSTSRSEGENRYQREYVFEIIAAAKV